MSSDQSEENFSFDEEDTATTTTANTANSQINHDSALSEEKNVKMSAHMIAQTLGKLKDIRLASNPQEIEIFLKKLVIAVDNLSNAKFLVYTICQLPKIPVKTKLACCLKALILIVIVKKGILDDYVKVFKASISQLIESYMNLAPKAVHSLDPSTSMDIALFIHKNGVFDDIKSDSDNKERFEYPFENLTSILMAEYVKMPEFSPKEHFVGTSAFEFFEKHLLEQILKQLLNALEKEKNCNFSNGTSHLFEQVISIFDASMAIEPHALQPKTISLLLASLRQLSLIISETNDVVDPILLDLLSQIILLVINLSSVPSCASLIAHENHSIDTLFQIIDLAERKLILKPQAILEKQCLAILVNLMIKGDECHAYMMSPFVSGKSYDGVKVLMAMFERFSNDFCKQSQDLVAKTQKLSSGQSKELASKMYKKILLENSIEVESAHQMEMFFILCFLSYIIASLSNYKRYLIPRIHKNLSHQNVQILADFLHLTKMAVFSGEDGNLIDSVITFWDCEVLERRHSV